MTDIQGVRAQLRDARQRPVAVASSGGGGSLPFWIIAAAAAGLAFAIVMLAPRFYTMQRTASLPVAQEAGRAEPVEVPPPVPAASPQPAARAPASQPAVAAQSAPALAPAAHVLPPVPSRYAGKTPEDVVRTVEIVCDERARIRAAVPAPPNAPKTVADERLHCFLTEAPQRFCAPNQKRKATADIINYFKGIEYKNTAISVAAKLQGGSAASAPAVIDPKVVEAIEAVIKAGYLTKAHREEIGANVPPEYKVRFVPIIPSTPTCPKPPWWAAFL